jgi:DNA-binding XRE family transcriptional regulator
MEPETDNPVMTSDDLKRWRSELGLNQAEAAAALGLSHRTITAYEIGEWAIPLAIVYACRWLDEQTPRPQPGAALAIVRRKRGRPRKAWPPSEPN